MHTTYKLSTFSVLLQHFWYSFNEHGDLLYYYLVEFSIKFPAIYVNIKKPIGNPLPKTSLTQCQTVFITMTTVHPGTVPVPNVLPPPYPGQPQVTTAVPGMYARPNNVPTATRIIVQPADILNLKYRGYLYQLLELSTNQSRNMCLLRFGVNLCPV